MNSTLGTYEGSDGIKASSNTNEIIPAEADAFVKKNTSLVVFPAFVML